MTHVFFSGLAGRCVLSKTSGKRRASAPRRAPANEKVRSEFGSKISRERIGHEVGCNSTQNPCSSIFFVCMFADGSHDVREKPY